MPELVRRLVRSLDEDVRPDCLAQPGEQLTLGQVQNLGQQAVLRGAAGSRDHAQYLLRRIGKSLDAQQQRVAQRAGQPARP